MKILGQDEWNSSIASLQLNLNMYAPHLCGVDVQCSVLPRFSKGQGAI